MKNNKGKAKIILLVFLFFLGWLMILRFNWFRLKNPDISIWRNYILWPLLFAKRNLHWIFTHRPCLASFRYLLGVIIVLGLYPAAYFILFRLPMKIVRGFIRLQTKFQRFIQNIRKPEAESRRLEKRERDEEEIEED